MEFTMESRYGKKTLADMSRALRKTTRKKNDRRSMIWAWIVLLLNLLFFLVPGENGFVWDWKRVLNGGAALMMIVIILRQDAINGFFARKRMLKGNGYSRLALGEEGYTTSTENATTQWNYQALAAIGETEQNLVFILDKRYAQAWEKDSLEGGTMEQLRQFLTEKTGLPITRI